MKARAAIALTALGAVGWKMTVEGALTLDTGLGRRTRPLGCPATAVAAPRATVFDVLCAPYAERQFRTMNC